MLSQHAKGRSGGAPRENDFRRWDTVVFVEGILYGAKGLADFGAEVHGSGAGAGPGLILGLAGGVFRGRRCGECVACSCASIRGRGRRLRRLGGGGGACGAHRRRNTVVHVDAHVGGAVRGVFWGIFYRRGGGTATISKPVSCVSVLATRSHARVILLGLLVVYQLPTCVQVGVCQSYI